MLSFAAKWLMDAEMEARTGAAHGVATRHVQGKRLPRARLDTRAGRIELEIPRLGKGSYSPSFLEPRRTTEKALVAVIQEAYVHGVSKRQVSRLAEEIYERVNPFLTRPLGRRLDAARPSTIWLPAAYRSFMESRRRPTPRDRRRLT